MADGSNISPYRNPYIKQSQRLYFEHTEPIYQPNTDTRYIPAPTRGLNSLDPLTSMQPDFATILTNWVARETWCELRGGYRVWVQALGNASIESLMCYRPAGSAQKLFAALGTEIWDVSIAASPTLQLSGLSNSRWQHTNFTPSGGSNNLLIVNGADSYRLYNGTTWNTPTITGVASSTFVQVNVHKRRVWFIENNSTRAWYLATDAISGAASLFDLGALMTKGGSLVAMTTWVVDGGQGPDDLAVFISSEGQVIIYKGTDPNNSNLWALVGVFDLPRPIGRRCFVKIDSDVGLITLQGMLPLSKSLPFDPSSVRSTAITRNIQQTMLNSAQMGKDLFGWQGILFPGQALLIMNVPVDSNVTANQFVMTSTTGAWSIFTGWNAACFEIYNDSLYFGDYSGNVNLAYTGGLDLVDPILFELKTAFNYLEQPGRNKNITFVRPFLIADGTLSPTFGIDVDFGNATPTASVQILNPSGGIWDVSLWDVGVWSSGQITVTDWQGAGAIGTAVAMHMAVNLAGGTGGSTSLISSSVFDTGVFDTMLFDASGAAVASGLGIPTLQLNAFELIAQYGSPI